MRKLFSLVSWSITVLELKLLSSSSSDTSELLSILSSPPRRVFCRNLSYLTVQVLCVALCLLSRQGHGLSLYLSFSAIMVSVPILS